MDTQKISTLTPKVATLPLHIRVLRKWVPFHRRDLCFLFVDKHGDAIEAIADPKAKTYFEVTMRVNFCYTIRNYICAPARPQFRIVDHDSCIMFGNSSSVVPIEDGTLPKYFFNFTTFDLLETRLQDQNKLLTDYIGRVVSVYEVPNKNRSKLTRVKLQDESQNNIDIALWEQTATAFDQNAATCDSGPVILAITSLKVSIYAGSLQLSSTAATETYINPAIEQLTGLIQRFSHIPINTLPSPPSHNEAAENNIIPLSDALYQLNEMHTKSPYTCLARIINIEISASQTWYYDSCSKCKNKVYPNGPSLSCLEHGIVETPSQRYRFVATICDESCCAKAIFFDEVATSLLGITCNDMVNSHHTMDPHVLPIPLRKIKEKPYIFQIQSCSESYDKSVSITKIFQAPKSLLPSSTSTLKRQRQSDVEDEQDEEDLQTKKISK